MTFISMQNKILKKLKKQLNVYFYNYKTFDHFAKVFNKDIYLSSRETFIIRDFPRIEHFVIVFYESVYMYDVEPIKDRAQELLRLGICTLLVTNEMIVVHDMMPCVNVTAEKFLKELSEHKTNALLYLEPIFEDRLKLPRAKNL